MAPIENSIPLFKGFSRPEGKRVWEIVYRGRESGFSPRKEYPIPCVMISRIRWCLVVYCVYLVKRIFRYLHICIGIMSSINLLQNIVFLPILINRKMMIKNIPYASSFLYLSHKSCSDVMAQQHITIKKTKEKKC